MDIYADTIFYNGNIYTLEDNENVTSLAVKEGKILDLDTYDNIIKYKNSHTKMYNLKNQTVIPGLIDGHMSKFFRMVL
jgi:predicted amidohydrolase YtcJ